MVTATGGAGGRGLPAGLTIRRYREADRAAVWRLHNVALQGVGAHAGNGPWDEDLHDIARVYLEAGGEFLVGEVGARLLAMGGLRRLDAETGEIKRMRVEPGWQRRGFGRAILGALEAHARRLGYARLRLDTTVGQTAAQGLYAAAGFRPVGRARLAGFECILYEKSLIPPGG